VRIHAGQLHSTRQQVIRIDYEGEPLSDSEVRESLRERVLKAAHSADAIIVSDYNYGVADAEWPRSPVTRLPHERFQS